MPSQFPWQKAYKAAALESDNSRLPQRIQTAEVTLLSRLTELTNRAEDRVEMNALKQAMNAIRTMKRKRLGVG